MATTIETVVSIRGGGLKLPWRPDVVYIDNVPFLHIKQSDHKLAMFVTGERRDSKPLPPKVFDNIKSLRDDAVQALIRSNRSHASELFTDADTPDAKRFKLTDSVRAQLPAVVSIDLPDIDGVTHVNTRVQVDLPRKNVRIELTANVMDWLRAAIQESIEDGVDQAIRRRPVTRAVGTHRMRLEHRRNEWYIRYTVDNTQKYHREPIGAEPNSDEWPAAMEAAAQAMVDFITTNCDA